MKIDYTYFIVFTMIFTILGLQIFDNTIVAISYGIALGISLSIAMGGTKKKKERDQK